MRSAQEHVRGKKHVQAARVKEARAAGRYCECCDKVFTGDNQVKEHMKGRKHREAAALAARGS